MELGATVCLPNRAPLCDLCPARAFCTARLTGRTGQLPVKAAKRPGGWRSVPSFSSSTKTGWPCGAGRDGGFWPGCGSTPTSSLPPGTPWPAGALLPPPSGALGRGSISSPTSSGACPPWRRRRAPPRCRRGWVWADRAALAGNTPSPNAFQPFQGAVEERLGHF